MSDTCHVCKKSVANVLAMELRIPDYQRPYKWTARNVTELLTDISQNIFENAGKEYRVGTVIFHAESGRFYIVDGQQRIFTFVLLSYALKNGYSCPLIKDKNFRSVSLDKVTQRNLNSNYRLIKEYIDSLPAERREKIKKAIESNLKFIVVTVLHQQEAFQLFDSQNTRGKRLNPHDLLKAYHLREMSDEKRMKNVAVRWESVECKDRQAIRNLFDLYLHPILLWSNGDKCVPFTEREIILFKGVSAKSGYSYGLRTVKSMPYYQLSEQFVSGEHFFGMVQYYLDMLNHVSREVERWESFGGLLQKERKSSVGFKYAKRLFYCALMSYYDRFANFEPRAVLKLFRWAFMVRVDMENLGFDTINKYATGDIDGDYSNRIAMFRRIRNARSHQEIEDLQIVVSDEVAMRHGNIYVSYGNKSRQMAGKDERRIVYEVLAGNLSGKDTDNV